MPNIVGPNKNPFVEFNGLANIPDKSNVYSPMRFMENPNFRSSMPQFTPRGGVGNMGQFGMIGSPSQPVVNPNMQLRAIIELLRRMGM
jgi:hypothetical protein|tara:strand:+ start:116 stop:379 length:264 start_codon:yes stop_codon:yes gene_type:complete